MTTTTDIRKSEADILIEYANGGSYTIKIKDGVDLGSKKGVRQHYDNGNVEVSASKLEQLQKRYKVEPNF